MVPQACLLCWKKKKEYDHEQETLKVVIHLYYKSFSYMSEKIWLKTGLIRKQNLDSHVVAESRNSPSFEARFD